MKNLIYLVCFIFSTHFIFAQISETEPNNDCGESGIITISSPSTYVGLVDHTDFGDYWYIQAGSSGDVMFSLSVGDPSGVSAEVICFTTGYCTPLPGQSNTLTTGLNQITLISANFYVIRINSLTFDGSDYGITITGGVLPVELSSFSAKILDNQVELNWQTATEVNNYGFEIERQSTTVNSDNLEWKKIGFVEGHGNSNSIKYYSFIDPSLSASGEYYYRLKQIDIDGQYEYSDVVKIESLAPLKYQLNQNYPNPFNPSTMINYSIPEQTSVKLIVYNIFGEEITKLVNDTQEAGNYSVLFNGKNNASGIYFYNIETKNYLATRKFVLLK